MIHADISVYPMGTPTTSASLYVARAVETLSGRKGIRYAVGPMGTLIESESARAVFEAAEAMAEAVHNLGVGRVEVVIKIDSRRDSHAPMSAKLDSVARHADGGAAALAGGSPSGRNGCGAPAPPPADPSPARGPAARTA